MTVQLPVLSHPSSYRPIPLHSLPLRSVGGGEGGKDDPACQQACGLVVPYQNPKTSVVIMIKGPQSRGLRAPRSALVTYAITTACYKPNTTRTKPRNTRTRKRAATTKKGEKKKNRCGAWPWCRCRARSTGRGRRACAGRREHKGNPKPPEGVWVSPAPERKRRKEKTRRRRNQPDKKKKRDTYKKPNTGRGLKGLKTIQDTNPRDKNATQSTR